MPQFIRAICCILSSTLLLVHVGPLFAQNAPPAQPLVVFLVHGLGGDANSFGKMPEVLMQEFGKGGKLIVKKLVYDTKSAVKSQGEFVEEIAVQMAQTYKVHGLNPAVSPFAFVVHSQGGIVARNYLSDCIRNLRCDRQGQPAVPKKPVLLFTLGTPHWGSPMANKVSDGSLLAQMLTWAGGKMDGQYKHLSIGSTLMYNDRSAVIRYSPQWRAQNTRYFVPGMRVVSIGGNVANDLQRFSAPIRGAIQQLFSNDINEDDIVVPVSHSNPDFHYYVEQQEGQTYKTTAQEGDIKLADESYLVRLPHTEFASNVVEKLFDGIAAPQAAEHVGLEYVLRELARNWFRDEAKARLSDARIRALTQQQRGDSPRVREFSSEVIISMPIGYQRKPQLPLQKAIAEHIFMQQKRGSILDEGTIETLAVPNSLAFKPYGLNAADFEQVNKPYFAFYHAGRFAAADAAIYGKRDKRARLCYSLVFPGFKGKSFCTTVSPGETAFAKVVLEPWMPIADAKAFVKSSRQLRNGVLVVGLDYKSEMGLAISLDGRNRTVAMSKGELQAAGLGGQSLEDLQVQCAVGVMAEKVGVHKNEAFAEPVGGESRGSFETGQRVEVIGRVTDASKSSDRYLIKVQDGFLWINTVDVDIQDGEQCSRGFFRW